MILFASALSLLVAAVFLFVRREDNDFAKLNESVKEMIAQADSIQRKAGEQSLVVDEMKKAQDETLLQVSALAARVEKLEKGGQKLTLEIGETSKPFFVKLMDARESKRISTPSPKVAPLVKDAKKILKEQRLSQ